MIVADTNVVAYLHLPHGDLTAAARRALERDPAWAAPSLWRSEFRNVLTTHMRRAGLSLSAALAAQAQAEALLHGREYAVDSERVLTLATRSGRTAYDCEFVAVAQEHEVALVTADRQLAASFPDVAVSLRDFAAG